MRVKPPKNIAVYALVSGVVSRYIQLAILLAFFILNTENLMSTYLFNYPGIPEETLRAATGLYGKGNIYLRMGDRLDDLLVGLLSQSSNPFSSIEMADEKAVQYILLNIFQSMEELANNQIVEAVRHRVDLKYALHFSLHHPAPDSTLLCEFRKYLLNDSDSQQILQKLLDRLNELGLYRSTENRPVEALQLLNKVCTMNRFYEVVEGIHRLLESLAFADLEWLRQTAKPYWYERYNRRRRLAFIPFSDESWAARSAQIGADVQYLLGEIDKSRKESIASLPEVQAMRRMWDEQFIIFSEEENHKPEYRWRMTRCASCSMASTRKEA